MNWANGGITLFRSSKLMISVISAILTLSWFDCVESNERKLLTWKDDDFFLWKREEEKRSNPKFYAHNPCDFNFWTCIPVCIDILRIFSSFGNLKYLFLRDNTWDWWMKQWYIKWRRRQRYCLSSVLTKKNGVTCVYRKIVVLFQIFLDFYGSTQHEIPNLNRIRIVSDVDRGNRIIWVGIDFTASASYRQSYMQLYCAWWYM